MTYKITIFVILIALMGGLASAETVLTVEKVRELALEYNRDLQSAKEELKSARGEIVSARAGALPQITLDGRYTRNIKKPVIFFPEFDDTGTPSGDYQKIELGQNNDFNLAINVYQPLFNGGQVWTALSIAKIYARLSSTVVEQVESEIIYGAEGLFYNAILADSEQDVLKSSLEQLTLNLNNVEKFHEQGMVSDFELLRARVEKLNLEPQIIAAQSRVNIARKELKSFLGLSLEEDIVLEADYSDTVYSKLPPVDSLVNLAYEHRPDVKIARLEARGYDKAIGIARSNWLYPQLNLSTSYSWTASSDDFRITDRNLSKTWTVSALLTIPLFDGGRTIGEVRKAKTDYYQAVLKEEQMMDDVRLEVEAAYDGLIQAKRALSVQKETIDQADEGLRIANLRYQTGIGTQLEILSAQTALTDARTNLARAVYNFRLAKSALKKAIGYDVIENK